MKDKKHKPELSRFKVDQKGKLYPEKDVESPYPYYDMRFYWVGEMEMPLLPDTIPVWDSKFIVKDKKYLN